MFTKSVLLSALAAISSVSAHSWIECVDHDNTHIRDWMKGNSTNGVLVDPTMGAYAHLCKGWPRGKANPGNWIEESSFLSRNIQGQAFLGDTHACGPSQRSSSYMDGAPMASAAPGQTLNLRFGGNGHSRGAPMHPGGDPGQVAVMWAGKKETEITDISQITDGSLKTIAQGGFAEDAYFYPDGCDTPAAGLIDKGNWLKMTLPTDMEPGRHMLLWVWSFDGKPQWSSCFDVQVSGEAKVAPAAYKAPEPAAYKAPEPAEYKAPEPAEYKAPEPVEYKAPEPAPAAVPAPVVAAAAAVETKVVPTTVIVEPVPTSIRAYPPPRNMVNEKVNKWWI